MNEKGLRKDKSWYSWKKFSQETGMPLNHQFPLSEHWNKPSPGSSDKDPFGLIPDCGR